jgi:hypothetical protein
MVAQDIKSTTARHSKTLFSNRSLKIESKKHVGISAMLIGRDTGQTLAIWPEKA